MTTRLLCALLIAASLAGCDGGSSSSDVASSSASTTTTSGATTSAATPSTDASANAALISGTPTTSVKAGQRYFFQPAAHAANGGLLSFSIQNKPHWAEFDTSSGTLTGTPTESDLGNFPSIVVSASDGSATAALPKFSITVAAPAQEIDPTISGSPATSVVVGAAYRFQPTASAPEGTKLSFSISNKPTWASFDASTGILSGTPATANAGTTSGILISVSDGTAEASLSAFSISVTLPPVVGKVTLSGTPKTTLVEDSTYTFVPTATAPSGASLVYSIQNKPVWASFSSSTGELTGTPAAASLGTTSGIIISVRDGSATAALPAFSIEVTETSSGSATLNWVRPAENVDGSVLSNLAGYRVYYGTSESSLTQSVQLANAAQTSYTLGNLAAGTWYFSVRSYNSANVESSFSNTVSKTIQ